MNFKISAKLLFLILILFFFSCGGDSEDPNNRNIIDNDYFAVKDENARKFFIQSANALRNDDPRRALKFLLQANKMEPNNVMILNTLGSVQSSLGQDKNACRNFEKALTVNDLDVTTHINYGTCLGQNGKYKQALEILQQGLSKTNKRRFEYYVLCFNLAVYNYKNGDCKQARNFVEQAKECTYPNEQFKTEVEKIFEVIDQNCL